MDRKILIVGQSHTEALVAAVRETARQNVIIVNLNSVDRHIKLIEKIRLGGYLPEVGAVDLVVSMIGGNFYNTFGLIENPIKFEFSQPGEPDFALAPDRELITYGLIRHFFEDAMTRGFLKNIAALRDHYNSRRFAHVSSPPPVGENAHIEQNPGGYFSDKVHLGVSPPKLRLKLYTLHEAVVQAFCRKEGIEILPPPPPAVTDTGFLERRFWKKDPTHANAAYGRLVLEQIHGILENE